MAYIRSKLTAGGRYLYLVQSVWDPKRGTSRQEIIKYLGKASEATLEDVPAGYRDNPKIGAFFAGGNAGKSAAESEKSALKLRDISLVALTGGDLDGAIGIYETYAKTSTLGGFYENVLKPAMYEIGSRWAENRISIAQEHVSSNVASELIGVIGKRNPRPEDGGKARILICSPSGEEHNLGCGVLRSFLQSRGYGVSDMSPSAPSESIMRFIGESKPDLVLVSITMKDNIRTGQRLVKKIRDRHKVPVLVGGQALDNYYDDDGTGFGCGVVAREPLEKILKIIKNELKRSKR